jgi:hypothetical protein
MYRKNKMSKSINKLLIINVKPLFKFFQIKIITSKSAKNFKAQKRPDYQL